MVYLIWFAAAACVVFMVFLAGRPLVESMRRRRMEEARRTFHQQRERLEAKFVDLASQSGKPRGLRWVDCDFEDPVTFARDRDSGAIAAFVAA